MRSTSSWFHEATYGLFIHWGPYAVYGRGEQVLMRELLDQHSYARDACQWRPLAFNADDWARIAVQGGFRYAVLTARHHDGFCLWDTATTDYSSARQSASRDFVAEYVDAFRHAGLRVGLYYSWCDFRIPALFDGPDQNPSGWERLRAYVHAQVRELMSAYGKIDILWFDGAWPGSREDWKSRELVKEVRRLQPGILINNRLGFQNSASVLLDEHTVNQSNDGDFGTPEREIVAVPGRLWESCQVSTWRLWGYSPGERWWSADVLLDRLLEASSQGGNLLLNVGPDADGNIPEAFCERSQAIGEWLAVHGEAVYGVEAVDAGEAVLFGWQTRRGRMLYLIIRFWPGPTLRFHGLMTPVRDVVFLTTGQPLSWRQDKDDCGLRIDGLPECQPNTFFPVIRVELDGDPSTWPTYQPGLWTGDPGRLKAWAAKRGPGGMADGSW